MISADLTKIFKNRQTINYSLNYICLKWEGWSGRTGTHWIADSSATLRLNGTLPCVDFMDVTMGDVPNSLVLIFTKDCISHFQLTSKEHMWRSKVFRALLFLSCSLIGWTSQDGTRSSGSWLYKPLAEHVCIISTECALGSTLNVLAESTLVVCFTENSFEHFQARQWQSAKCLTYCFLQLCLNLWNSLRNNRTLGTINYTAKYRKFAEAKTSMLTRRKVRTCGE